MGLDEISRHASEKRGSARGGPSTWNPPYCGDIGLRIRADGTWLYQESAIGRLSLVKLFASVLRREAGGRHYLVTPVEKVDIAVDDAPFLAVGMEVAGAGRGQTLTFRTNVDDVVTAGPEHPLRFVASPPEGGLKPYLLVRDGLEALLTRANYHELVGLAVTERIDGRDTLGLWSGGRFFPLTESGGASQVGA